MKAKIFVICLLAIVALLSACRRDEIASPPAPPIPTPEIIVETVIAPQTVVVTVTAAPESEPPTLTTPATPTTEATPVPTAPPSPTLPPPTATRPAVPTATPVPTAPAAGPTILYFRANVAIADPGQTIQLEWDSAGAVKATVGHLFDFRMYPDASDLPPSGVFEYAIRSSQRNSITFFLTVIDEEDRWAMENFTLPLTCPDPWFFSPAPDSCPVGPARVSAGAEQRFEHGYMLWEAAERRIYILFDNGSPRWNVVADTWQEGEEICQLEPAPPGRVHPTRGFGKAWCNDPGLRDRLGWALNAEVGGYQTAVQSTAFDRYNRLYIRAADGGVWELLPERSGWEKLSP